jgi:Right handed beta helix region
VRPVITVSDTNQCIQGGGSGNDMNWIENLELSQGGASGAVIDALGHGSTVYNVKISDGGAQGINQSASLRNSVIACEITGVLLDGILCSAGMNVVGSYIHDNSQNGLQFTGGGFVYVVRSIIDSNTARGIFCNGAITSPGVPTVIADCTIYGNGNSGLEVTDTDWCAIILSSIFSENGNAAGEYNVEWTAGSIEISGGMHSHNVFHHSGGGGGANLSGLTTNSTESTSSPAFTNAASGDFSISSASPAKATGFPTQFLGGNANYLDMGAVQRQESGGQSSYASVS